MTAKPARYIMVFIVVMLSAGINFGQHALPSLNFDHSYLVMTLAVLAITGLMAHRHLFFILLVCGLAFAINLPEEFLQQYHINSDVLISTLAAVVLAPAAQKFLGVTSNAREIAR
jgi:hypothetical protein